MLERIVTIITGVWFLSTAVVGITLGTLDIIYYVFTKSYIFDFSDFFLINIIMTPPIGLILIYLGKGLDIVFKLKEK
jgi:hypothetical protein